MFGFLRPPPHLGRARQAYARLCQYQRMHYGALSLPFLSYEGALLYLFSAEAGWFPAPEASAPVCCRLRKNNTLVDRPEAPLGRFCASLGLLLGAIKLDDDVRDGGLVIARTARWLLKSQFRAARAFFRSLDERFDKTVSDAIAGHLTLEQPGRRIPLEQYAEPTAEAFGYVFSLLERLVPQRADAKSLRELGRYVGAAIIAFDCAVDWPRDQRTGDFNPLRDAEDVRAAFDDCRRSLTHAAALCRHVHGEASTSARVFDAVAERVSRRRRNEMLLRCGETAAAIRSMRPRRAGIAFSDFGLLAFGDCVCEGLGSCCEVGGGAAEGSGECCGGECCGDGFEGGSCFGEICCVACVDPCCDTGTRKRQKQRRKEDIDYLEPAGKPQK